MKKRKTYEISIIDKTYSKIISDETKFYTSDTALELGFELKETEYDFESAEIVLLNVDDRSLVTRPVAKSLDSFTYELDDDITAHYGEWRGQLRFEQAGEIYVSSPVKFRIENDLSNERPPQLSDVQSWVSLKRYADSLVDELKQAVLSVEGIEDTFNSNETVRQNQFETNESERTETFNTNEMIRQTQELEREKAETNRQTIFDNNEAGRFETFNTNETTRQVNENARQQAETQRQLTFETNESERQTTFETNETERQTTFETAEQERQSAELIRVENEKQRNLTSVDEFIKLQDSIGGRNVVKSGDVIVRSVRDVRINTHQITWFKENIGKKATLSFSIKGASGKKATVYPYQNSSGLTLDFIPVELNLTENYTYHEISGTVVSNAIPTGYTAGLVMFYGNSNTSFDVIDIKIEKGTLATPSTKAPEDYTVVSKDDYYNHIEMMSEHRDKEIAELKNAITTLGGS